MAIYIIELCLILVLGYFLQCRYINKKTFIICSFFIMAVILGLRGNNVGEDTKHFLRVFEYSKNVTWKTALTSGTDVVYNRVYNVDLSIEVGYLVLNKIIHFFTDNGQWVLISCAIVTCWLIGKFIYDNTEDVFMATYIFMCESLYMHSFNLMRQLLALSIGIQAYTYLKKNNYKKAIGCILIAFLFHKSSIILFILIPLFLIKNNKKSIKYIVISSIAINFMIPMLYQILYIFIPRYSNYLKVNHWGASVNGKILLWLIEIGICIFICSRKKINDKETFVIISCAIIYLALEFMGLNISMFQRMALFFSTFLMFLFPIFSRYFYKTTKVLYKLILLTILTISFISYAGSDTRVYYFFWQ